MDPARQFIADRAQISVELHFKIKKIRPGTVFIDFRIKKVETVLVKIARDGSADGLAPDAVERLKKREVETVKSQRKREEKEDKKKIQPFMRSFCSTQ